MLIASFRVMMQTKHGNPELRARISRLAMPRSAAIRTWDPRGSMQIISNVEGKPTGCSSVAIRMRRYRRWDATPATVQYHKLTLRFISLLSGIQHRRAWLSLYDSTNEFSDLQDMSMALTEHFAESIQSELCCFVQIRVGELRLLHT